MNGGSQACSQALALIADYLDGMMTTDQSGWMRLHLESCAECRSALARIAEAEGELLAWAESRELESPPNIEARGQLAAGIQALGIRQRRFRWMPIAAAAIAAGFALMVIGPHRTHPSVSGHVNRATDSFVGITYLPPLDPRENAVIVRMDLQVASLIAAGYGVTAEPDAIVPADVLVGQDGRARAVRVLTDIGLKGKGD
jgi:hypothetical protein